jgi:hypothetical protein
MHLTTVASSASLGLPCLQYKSHCNQSFNLAVRALLGGNLNPNDKGCLLELTEFNKHFVFDDYHLLGDDSSRRLYKSLLFRSVPARTRSP